MPRRSICGDASICKRRRRDVASSDCYPKTLLWSHCDLNGSAGGAVYESNCSNGDRFGTAVDALNGDNVTCK